MKYKFSKFLICLFSITALSSCRTIFDYFDGVKIIYDQNIKNGKISIYYEKSSFNEEDKLQIGDKLYVKTIPNEGYVLDKLYVNGDVFNDSPYFTIKKEAYNIKATFKEINFYEDNKNYLINDDFYTYYDIENTKGMSMTPSTGNVNILVVPIEFSDYDSFSKSQIESINVAFNGSNNNKTNSYWESVSSFYNKSSYGKLRLNFDICDTYIPSISGSQFKNLEKNDGDGSIFLLDECRDKLKINNSLINYKNYDSDDDGYVDGIWLIYNANKNSEVYGDNNDFWAYTFSYLNDSRNTLKKEPNKENPNFARYANCSQLFLYSDDLFGYDAHTLIHEQGHMFGLDDYYTYDKNVASSATGGLDMMDLNIGDHDSFSKFSLGWIKPKVVEGDSTLKILPISTSGEAIILPVTSNINNPFNEYYIIEFYTPTNLYSLDANKSYRNKYPKYFLNNGIRISHIDSRLIDYRNTIVNSNNLDINGFNNPFNYEKYYNVGCSNTASNSYNKSNKGFYNLIETINPYNIKSYNNFYYNDGGTSFLFTSGDVFNTKMESNFFIDNEYNHDKTKFNYSLRVEYVCDDYATISIKKV